MTVKRRRTMTRGLALVLLLPPLLPLPRHLLWLLHHPPTMRLMSMLPCYKAAHYLPPHVHMTIHYDHHPSMEHRLLHLLRHLLQWWHFLRHHPHNNPTGTQHGKGEVDPCYHLIHPLDIPAWPITLLNLKVVYRQVHLRDVPHGIMVIKMKCGNIIIILLLLLLQPMIIGHNSVIQALLLIANLVQQSNNKITNQHLLHHHNLLPNDAYLWLICKHPLIIGRSVVVAVVVLHPMKIMTILLHPWWMWPLMSTKQSKALASSMQNQSSSSILPTWAYNFMHFVNTHFLFQSHSNAQLQQLHHQIGSPEDSPSSIVVAAHTTHNTQTTHISITQTIPHWLTCNDIFVYVLVFSLLCCPSPPPPTLFYVYILLF